MYGEKKKCVWECWRSFVWIGKIESARHRGCALLIGRRTAIEMQFNSGRGRSYYSQGQLRTGIEGLAAQLMSSSSVLLH